MEMEIKCKRLGVIAHAVGCNWHGLVVWGTVYIVVAVNEKDLTEGGLKVTCQDWRRSFEIIPQDSKIMMRDDRSEENRIERVRTFST